MSLWRMSGVAGATVPDGFILSTVFFERWFAHLAQQPCWDHMLECCRNYSASDHESADALHRACEATKEASRSLTLDASQQTSIEAALSSMRSSSQGAMRFVAVRSSSPEEDLAGMSFAGGYESVLGVHAAVEAVQAAVQTVFASCLDERVFIYKIQHDIADKTPRIAAVVQRQVASVVAGVAFSLDPLSNCYDWATINTNFGLGETVVGGQCSPDYYLVNKLTGKVLESSKGKKEKTAWLDEGGGVVERPGDAEAWTLSPAEVATVVEQLVALESFYGKAPRPPLPSPTPPSPPPSPPRPGHPVDTEFALDEQRRLVWLQARPVTTHLSLPPQLQTPAGAKEVLWLDIMQVVQGFTEPMSVCGLSFAHVLLAETAAPVALGLKLKHATIHNRPFIIHPESGLGLVNASFILNLIGFRRREAWASKLELMDFSCAKVVRELESPDITKSAIFVPLPLCLAWSNPGTLINAKLAAGDLDTAVRRAEDWLGGSWNLLRDLFRLFGHPIADRGAFQAKDRCSNTFEWFARDVNFPPTEAPLIASPPGIAQPAPIQVVVRCRSCSLRRGWRRAVFISSTCSKRSCHTSSRCFSAPSSPTLPTAGSPPAHCMACLRRRLPLCRRG